MRMSFPLATRLVQGGAVCLLGAMVFVGCSNPMRAKAPGGGSATSTTGLTATGGFQPVTINLGLGGRFGTGGVLGFGGSSSSGGAVSTGGAGSTSTTECTAGRCLVTLASGRERVWPGVAVDDASVYWTEHPGWYVLWPGDVDGRVMKVPADGGAPTTLASRQDFPSFIRVDATSVYWTTYYEGMSGELYRNGYAMVMRLPLDSSEPSTVASIWLSPGGSSSDRRFGGIAMDATSVYWAYEGMSRSDYVDGSILRASLADGSFTTLASEQWRPYQIEVDGSSVYWVNGTSQDDTDTTLMKMPLAGGAVTTLDASPSGHRAIALDATCVYWTSSDGTVMKIPLEGGTPVTIASGQPDPGYIAVDATSVYWVNWGDATIMKLPLEGGMPTMLVSGQPLIRALAVDARSVYWTTLGTPDNEYKDGTVMKLTPK